MSDYDDDRARTRYWDEDGKTELAYGTPYELAVQVHRLRTERDAERKRREAAEKERDDQRESLQNYQREANAIIRRYENALAGIAKETGTPYAREAQAALDGKGGEENKI